MPDALPDYYGVLGVAPGATPEEIHSAFRHRAQECHPDLHPGEPDAVERFKQVNEAYHLLSNERERKAYDAELTSRSARHHDVEVEVTIGLRELYLGCRVRLMVPRVTPCSCCAGAGTVLARSTSRCPSCGGSGWGNEEIYLGVRGRQRCGRCQGRGKLEETGFRQPCLLCRGLGGFLLNTPADVRIPPGLFDGQMLLVEGQGKPLLQGGVGDLYVRVNVRRGPWSRDGENLVVDLELPAHTLKHGGKVPFSTPLEQTVLKIPRGSKYGAMIRLEGLGPPWPEENARGDLWVRLVPAPSRR